MVSATTFRRVEQMERRESAGPVFVTGAPYSGATLLARSLALHPELDSIDGGVELEALLFAAEAISAGLQPATGPVTRELESARASDDERGWWGEPPSASVAALMRLEAAGRDDHWCVVGAPELALHLDLLARLFPAARLVHVVRDVESAVCAATHEGSPHGPDEAIRSWLTAARACVRAERALGPETALRISYADLVASPEAALKRVTSFLGVVPSPDCVWPLRTLAQPFRPPTEAIAGIGDDALTLSRLLLEHRPVRAPDGGGRSAPEDAPPLSSVAEDAQAGPIRRLVAAVVPAGYTVAVISRGDDALVRLPGRYGWHFPRTARGQYTGHHPADNAEALGYLHAIENQGVRYLVIPASTAWWLDRYEEFAECLEQDASVVGQSPWCTVYRLRMTAPHARTRESDSRGSTLIREPNNRQATTAIARTPPRRDDRALPGNLWAVTAYYNPAGYRNKRENYRAFRSGLADRGVPLLTVEAAFGDEPVELSPHDAEVLVQLRGSDVLWQKERLLNLAIERLPESCDKVAWLDGDVLFANDQWAAETARLLEMYCVVQLFSHCARLPRGASSCEPAFLPFGPGENELFHGVAYGVATRGPAALEDFFLSGHTGYGWAARREVLEGHGLYDANPLGNGDMDIAQAMWGNRAYFAMDNRSAASKPHLERWASRFAAHVDGSVGYVDGLVLHLWHGDSSGRSYDDRLRSLSAFDPENDLEIDLDTGLYRWKHPAGDLRDFANRYFELRQEE